MKGELTLVRLIKVTLLEPPDPAYHRKFPISSYPFPATIMAVEITFDPAKNERNLRERNLGFEEASEFDFASADYEPEERKGEHRIVAVGYLRGRLHVLCFIPKPGGIRVISFRKANDREARKHGKPKTIDG